MCRVPCGIQCIVSYWSRQLVLSRLDYCRATLTGLPARLLDRLQSVLNAAERLVYGSPKYDHVTPLLKDLHWLRVPERIALRLAVLVYRCQQARHTLLMNFTVWLTSSHDSGCVQLRLRRWSCQIQYTPRSATVPVL